MEGSVPDDCIYAIRKRIIKENAGRGLDKKEEVVRVMENEKGHLAEIITFYRKYVITSS